MMIKGREKRIFIFTFIAIIFITLFFILLFAIRQPTTTLTPTTYQYKQWKTIQTDTVDYKIFYIDKMPCVWVAKFRDGSGDSGVSCDWSKYQPTEKIEKKNNND